VTGRWGDWDRVDWSRFDLTPQIRSTYHGSPNPPARRGRKGSRDEADEATPEQIIAKLREADAKLASGATITEICKGFGVSETTFHRWRRACRTIGQSRSSQRYHSAKPKQDKASSRQGLTSITEWLS
jgi:hypothetical protein